MNQQIEKLRLIYMPFLIIAVSVISGYTFLNWLLVVKLHVFSVKKTIIDYWVPCVFLWIPIIIWLRPRIKLLNLDITTGNLPGLYYFIAYFAILIPTSSAQFYMESATDTLTPLDHITQIENHEPTRYYSLKTYYIDKRHIGVQSTLEVSQKYHDYIMNLFLVLPIYVTSADTSNSTCVAWYGINYREVISNDLNQKEKQERYQAFVHESNVDFARKDVNRFVYLESLDNTDDHDAYNGAIKNNRRVLSKSTTVLIPYNEPFEERNGNTFGWVYKPFGIGALIWLIMILIPKLDSETLERCKTGKPIKEIIQTR